MNSLWSHYKLEGYSAEGCCFLISLMGKAALWFDLYLFLHARLAKL